MKRRTGAVRLERDDHNETDHQNETSHRRLPVFPRNEISDVDPSLARFPIESAIPVGKAMVPAERNMGLDGRDRGGGLRMAAEIPLHASMESVLCSPFLCSDGWPVRCGAGQVLAGAKRCDVRELQGRAATRPS